MSRVCITRTEVQSLDTLCAGIITRHGEEEPCCKDATTVLFDRTFGGIWPACTWHANRNGGALSIAQLRTAIAEGGVWIEVPDE